MIRQKLTGKQLFKVLDKICKEESFVMRDDYKGYNILNNKDYVRLTVNHKWDNLV
ncbi:MAG: hypothetical protein LBB59_01310 [Campylobacteraceae bacterium]|nr:hypothetical protein [Campylobacteraceae bacterium]